MHGVSEHQYLLTHEDMVCTTFCTVFCWLMLSCAAGEWVSCDQVLLGAELFQGSYQWEDKPNFNINHCSTGNWTVSLGITIKGAGQYICISFNVTYYCSPMHLFAHSTSSRRPSLSKWQLQQSGTLLTASATPLEGDS